MSAARKKVAILGGGAASMATAYALSKTPELREQIEVTVYQMGWRLGGKGANGRNAAIADRIEEHGLHVWGGFYYNAFRTMQECYAALGRPKDAPLATWDKAFQRFPLVIWQEQVDGRWVQWPVETPTNSGVPGQGGAHPDDWEMLQSVVGWIKTAIEDFPHEVIRASAREVQHHKPAFGWLSRAIDWVEHAVLGLVVGAPLTLLHLAHSRAGSLRELAPKDRVQHAHGVLEPLEAFFRWLKDAWMHEIREHTEARRLFVLLDLALAITRGMIRDSVPSRGYMAIDDEDFTDWLRRHGADDLALQSAPLRGFYDYFFAYEDGDPAKPRMSAGMGLHHLLLVVGAYKGGLFWKMTSGMGDATFAPLYQVCRKNGVRFRFFHAVENLAVAADGKSIESVRIARQVDLRGEEYDPLVHPVGLPSWPSEPLDDQIVESQARELRRRGANLEDPWTDWDPAGTVELRAGVDYDALVLGISIGAFPTICREILARDEAWRTMVAKIQSIQTQALQLWWTPTVEDLGFTMGNATGTAYGQPLESWSDMSHVLERETWPSGAKPKAVIYFCGPMPNPKAMPTGRNPGFGLEQNLEARASGLEWCRRFLPHLLPATGTPGEIDWNLLHAPADQNGERRFDAQYVRANYTPSERYVLDLPGTNQFRLESDTSGYENLALAGDWLFTGLGGAVESAFISGLQAARALTGGTEAIVGETPSPWRRPKSLRPIVPVRPNA